MLSVLFLERKNLTYFFLSFFSSKMIYCYRVLFIRILLCHISGVEKLN